MKKQWKQCLTLFFWAPKSLQMVTAAMKLKDACSLEGVMTNLDSILKSKDITLPTKVHLVKAMVFPVVMYGWKSWTVKQAEHRRIDAFELWCWKRFLSPLDFKEIQPVHSKGDEPWVFFGRNEGKAETPVLSSELNCVLSRSVVSDSFSSPRTVAHQAPLSMGFSRREQWSEWVATSFFWGCSSPRDWTLVPCIAWQVLYHATTREYIVLTHLLDW